MTGRGLAWNLVVVLGCICLAGCGTGSNVHDAGTNNGRALVTIVWPSRPSRLIPAASNSIFVVFQNGGVVAQSKVLARPLSGNSTSVTFTNLPVGTLTLSAGAYPNADGTGTPQAQGSAAVAIQANNTTPVTLTMASTIQRLQILPSNTSLTIGAVVSLSASAFDSSGALVLIETANIRWTSSNPLTVKIDAAGTATGLSGGSATITATETESGIQASTNITVSSGSIVFMRNMGSNWVLYRMNGDGSNIQPVTSSLESATEPAISSDGTKVVFQLVTVPYRIDQINFALTNGNSQLYTINIDGTHQAQVTSGASCYHPGWSPDGTRITFQGERDGPEEVYVMNADGSNVNRITAIVGTNNATSDWSPDGSTIAYEYIATSDGVTTLVNPDGTNVRPIPGATNNEWGPAWSPDGSKLAYLATVSNTYTLFVMNVDGSGRHQLSARALDICKPCWSPDGTRVLFTSGGVIYSVRTDGTGEVAITDGTHQDAWPSWARG